VASAAEATLWQAVVSANAVRQAAQSAALATYAFVPANLAAYRAALVAADVAFVTSINSAASTASITPNVIPLFRGGFGPSISATIAS
jgi:hypothetical protein